MSDLKGKTPEEIQKHFRGKSRWEIQQHFDKYKAPEGCLNRAFVAYGPDDMPDTIERIRLGAPCGDCHKRCCAIPVMVVYPDEASKYLTDPHPRPRREGERILQRKPDGFCVYFDKGCTIYKDRPRTCKVWDCRVEVGGPDAVAALVKLPGEEGYQESPRGEPVEIKLHEFGLASPEPKEEP